MLGLFDVALCSVPLLFFVKFNTLLAPWQSRKVLHMGTGTLYILSDVHDPYLRYGIYAVSALNIVAVALWRPYSFSARGDVGITSYLALCACIAYLQIDFWRMAPMFYADPAGALVGRTVSSPELYGGKTLAGTAAVFAVAALTLWGHALAERIALGAAIACIELFAGKWDNPCIGGLLLLLSI